MGEAESTSSQILDGFVQFVKKSGTVLLFGYGLVYLLVAGLFWLGVAGDGAIPRDSLWSLFIILTIGWFVIAAVKTGNQVVQALIANYVTAVEEISRGNWEWFLINRSIRDMFNPFSSMKKMGQGAMGQRNTKEGPATLFITLYIIYCVYILFVTSSLAAWIVKGLFVGFFVVAILQFSIDIISKTILYIIQ